MATPLVKLMPEPKIQFFGLPNTGGSVSPLASGKLYTYKPGTTTDKATYTDSTALSTNTNPVILDASGRASVWLDGYYDMKLTDQNDVPIWTQSNVSQMMGSAPNFYSSDYASLNAAVVAIGATPSTLFINSALPNGAVTITVPNTLSIVFLRNGSITTTSSNITFNGPVVADLVKIFNGTGTLSFSSASSVELYPQWWGVKGDGVTDDTAAIQSALDSCGHNTLRFSSGTYIFTGPVNMYSYNILQGNGYQNTIFTSSLNVELITNTARGVGNNLIRGEVRDIGLHNTYPVVAGAGSTKFHIHMYNPQSCKIVNVHCKGNFVDTDHNDANHGGIWFENNGSNAETYLDEIQNCWIQNCQILFEATDSLIERCIIWGHTCQYAIKAAGGNLTIANNYDILGSRTKGTIWVTTFVGTKILNNTFDGGFSYSDNRCGIRLEPGVFGAQISGNFIQHIKGPAILANNVTQCVITDNYFYNCGWGSPVGAPETDVIYFNNTTAASNKNIIANNTFRTIFDFATITYAFNEAVNAGSNVFYGNTCYMVPTASYPLLFNIHPMQPSINQIAGNLPVPMSPTFTPTVTGSTGGTAVTSFTYGVSNTNLNVVFFNIALGISSLAGCSGFLNIGNLPLTALNNAVSMYVTIVTTSGISGGPYAANVVSNSKLITTNLPIASITPAASLQLSGFYFSS